MTKDRTAASDLVQGRVTLTVQDVRLLAAKLGIDAAELCRALTEDEREDWRFYRVSARNRIVVWERARAFWHSRCLSDTEAARTMGLHRARLSDVMTLRSRRVMNYGHALKLGRSLDAPLLPSSLVDGLPDGFFITR